MYEIFDKNGAKINTIEADLPFVERYCQKHGYAFKEYFYPTPDDRSETSLDSLQADVDFLAALAGVEL